MPAEPDIHARLRALEDKAAIPIIDPTANVLALVGAETKRQDDLREQAEKYQDKLAQQRRDSDSDARRAEASRIDALLVANTNNVALALEKQGAAAAAQDKRIAALEQNQYQGVGATGQRSENRQQSQWVIGLVIGLIVALVSIMMRFWK